MPDYKKQILQVRNAAGDVVAAQIPVALWKKLEPLLAEALGSGERPAPPEALDDLSGFEDFIRFWDFRYPYKPSVECPGCHARTDNWREDPARPFQLANANLGGLLVFHCLVCGGTVRQKYFKDHMAVEFTPAG